MVHFLQEVGLHVEVHRDHFEPDADDHFWIPECARQGWVILSGDKGLEKTAVNSAAVISCHAKVFLLTNNNLKGVEWAASIITGREKIQRIVDENDGPFFARVTKGHDGHVGDLRFVGDGKPKAKVMATQETAHKPSQEITANEIEAAAKDEAKDQLLF
jgi:hypothetical protein